jgi:hypothetical protein
VKRSRAPPALQLNEAQAAAPVLAKETQSGESSAAHTRSLDRCDAQGRGMKSMNANYLQDFKSLQHQSAA